MKRYFVTIWLFWTTALAAEMEYRLNFLGQVLSSALMLAGTMYGLRLLFKSGYQPGGWGFYEAMLPVGFYFMIDGFSQCVLRPNLGRIVQHVREGTLDFVLLKPMDPQVWLSLRNCAPWGGTNILVGAAVIIIGGVSRDPAVSIGSFAIGLIPTALSIAILYSIWFMLGTLTIWFVKIYNITEALQALLEAGKFPIGAYEPIWRIIFTFIVPVAFMTTVPSEVMLARENYLGWLLATAALASALFLISRLFFRFALRFYTSASS